MTGKSGAAIVLRAAYQGTSTPTSTTVFLVSGGRRSIYAPPTERLIGVVEAVARFAGEKSNAERVGVNQVCKPTESVSKGMLTAFRYVRRANLDADEEIENEVIELLRGSKPALRAYVRFRGIGLGRRISHTTCTLQGPAPANGEYRTHSYDSESLLCVVS